MPITTEQDWIALDSLEQGHLAKQVRRGNLACVKPMIVKIATESWVRLPPHTRIWFSQADAITAGVEYTVTHVAKVYDKKKGTKFSTFLFECLTNFFITQVSEPLRAQKRWEGSTISLDSSMVLVNNRFVNADFYLANTWASKSVEEETIARIDAQKYFMKVYDAATPNLRKYLIRWFLTTKIIHTKDGDEYRNAKRELRKLAPLHNFTNEMATFLVGNDPARLATAIEILKRYKTSQVFSKRRIIEYEEMVIQ